MTERSYLKWLNVTSFSTENRLRSIGPFPVTGMIFSRLKQKIKTVARTSEMIDFLGKLGKTQNHIAMERDTGVHLRLNFGG